MPFKDYNVFLLFLLYSSNILWSLYTFLKHRSKVITEKYIHAPDQKNAKAITALSHNLAFFQKKLTKCEEANLALLHDRLFFLCDQALSEGKISLEEMDNLRHLFTAYKHLGGNGDAESRYHRCEQL